MPCSLLFCNTFTVVSFQYLHGSLLIFLEPCLNTALIHLHILKVCWARNSAVVAKGHIWEEHFYIVQKHWSSLVFVPEGTLLHQRVLIKQDIWILQESIKKFNRNNTGFQAACLDKALASWLAAGWAGCRLPGTLRFPVGAAGSLGSQQASAAAGQLSIQESNQRAGKQKSLAAGIRGFSFPWKVSSFWLFILIQEEIYTCVRVCVSIGM